ncbi:MAG TPA: hypothetical protein VFS18_03530, partial [Actinomycetota bacterium]|nr:hypothetical protein [Actinomycetota bacterium]
MVTPTAGFDAATRIAGRRERAGETPAEGWSPYILSALGGAALMLLWLKVGALISLREGTADDFRWLYLVAASVMGAGVGLL